MMKISSLSHYGGKLLGLVLFALVLYTHTAFAVATIPQTPLLSLTADQYNYDSQIYPDGRLWIPPSTSLVREVLVPVFIKNNYYTINPDQYRVPPIKSFRFSVFYDSSALRAVGIQLNHPSYMSDILPNLNGTIDEDPPFAYGWNVTWDDRSDLNFWKYVDSATWASIKDSPGSQVKRGRRVTITGTSTIGMRHNDKQLDNQWFVLLYIKFKVIGKAETGNSDLTYLKTLMYIAPEDIRYNDYNVATDLPYTGFSYYDKTTYQKDYASIPNPAGLGGLNNEDLNPPSLFLLEPYKPGSITVRISNGEPTFAFPTDITEGYTISQKSPSYFELDQVITVDSNNANTPTGQLKITLTDGIERSRLSFIEISSSEPWLYTSTNHDATPRRYRTAPYIDNDILGTITDPGGVATTDDGPFYVNIICDPTKLDLTKPDDPEKTGVHVGYLTFKSPFAQYNDVRLKVTFIYIRSPYEPAGPANPEGWPGGIFLNIRNSRGSLGDQKSLVFGTGYRATDGVDSLFGEYSPTVPLDATVFDARFFPYNSGSKEDSLLVKTYPNGFGDYSPNYRAAYTSSRDIRDFNANKSHIFYCKFNAGDASNYPVVLTWDVSQFPAGSRVFLRDTLNGQLFQPIDMRAGTVIGNNLHSFTFQDASITSFLIEYTIPKQIKFVDQNEMPLIKTGWNFLSLPVRPVDNKWSTFYPRAINIPWFFSQNQYQQEANLRVGVGYFIKYGDSVDKFFSGTSIREIKFPNDAVKVYSGDAPDVDNPTIKGGWNAIGGCSTPINIADIKFTGFENTSTPQNSYVLQYGVWSYRTDLGYKEDNVLLPGLGYWIKVDNTGYLWLIAPPEPKISDCSYKGDKKDIIAASAKLSIYDNAQHSGNLYLTNNISINASIFEMPPTPPMGLYDVRFINNRYLSNDNSSIIKMQGVEYPVSLSMKNADADYLFTDALSGKVLGTIKRGTDGNIIVDKTLNNAVKVEKSNSSIETDITVYPNPVSDISTVSFNAPENGNVTIKIYNEIGVEVMTLVNSNYEAGLHTLALNASNLNAGSYLVKLTTGSTYRVAKINVVK